LTFLKYATSIKKNNWNNLWYEINVNVIVKLRNVAKKKLALVVKINAAVKIN
jgi:hypothetical protein